MIFLYHPITQIHTIHQPYLVIYHPSVMHHIPVPEIAFLIELLEVREGVVMKPEEQILFQRQEHPQIQTQIQYIEIEIPVLRLSLIHISEPTRRS